MSNINICHKDWNDIIILDFMKNTLYRISDNNETGKYILIDNILLIKWEKWGEEYFYKKNNNYYFIDNNKVSEHVSYIYLNVYDNQSKNEHSFKQYIIDNDLNKVYIKENLYFLGYIQNFNSYIIINTKNDKLLFFYNNFKYYDYRFIKDKYNFVKIDNINYLLSIDNNICYINIVDLLKNTFLNTEKNQNFSVNSILCLKENTYIKYKNRLLLNNNLYIIDETLDNDIICNYKILETNFDIEINYIDSSIFLKESNKNYIYFIDKYFDLFEYYENFNFIPILFDDIKNIKNNRIYHDDIKIIYYKTEEEYKYIQYNYSPNESIITEQYIKDLWYEINNNNIKNYDLLNLKNEKNTIPKIMHFIWIGKNKIPELYIQYIESWIIKHHDYIFCFWNDNNIPKLINQKYYDETDILAMKADILRYELLYFFGGIYIDCDFLCIKNIDEIINNYEGFSGWESEEYIAIGLMGFTKYNNFLYNIIRDISYNIITNKNENVPTKTGPIFFTKMWKLHNDKNNKYYAFPIEYFYSYTFENKNNNLKYSISNNNYAIHMWGYSWNLTKDTYKNQNIYLDDNEYFVLNYYLKNLIESFDNINKLNIDQLTFKLINTICFKYKNNHKKKIVNIMGLFFTGGIERYLYYLDKYGNHDKYDYYLLYISNDSYVYEINNIKMISFDWNHNVLNKLLINIMPELIIDHYSLYLQDNSDIYINLNKMNIMYFVHSAICYKNDISKLNIKKSIHLYNELEKNNSWNNILENYYVTLGAEINNISNNISKNKSINISIIGRIAEEKIPLLFFEKLCILSKKIYPRILINIYGEKDIKFNSEYVKQFEELILNSSIIYNNFINPLNMNEIYLKTDILLIPSKFETGSFTCIEGFCYGIPVFARNVYGLKYLIKHNITGYLFNDDDDILKNIESLTNKSYFLNKKNREIIKKESLKYNIIDKINDLENIINLNILEKNIVIITSVLNCINKPLSYYHIRSVFTLKERYKHTLKTILTIKKYIPNVEILYCECSDLSLDNEIENDIKSKVNYYYNFYNDDIIKDLVNSELKGLGELNIMMKGISILKSLNITYKNIFKISGRYYLNNRFDYNLFNCNSNNIFTYWDNSTKSYCTIFYKIDNNSVDLFYNTLINLKPELEKGESIEYVLCKDFKYNVKVVDKVNVSGFLATEGYLFSI